MNRKNADKEMVVVRRAVGYRVIYVLLIVFQFFGLIICFVESVQMGIAMLLPCCISILITILPLLYYLIWKISFTEKMITIVSIFNKHEYTYSQIKDVFGYSRGMGPDAIWLIFIDGKKIAIYSNDVGYFKAKRIILTHRKF